MASKEMIAVLEGNGDKAITGTVADAVAAFRAMRGKSIGKVSVEFTDRMNGLAVRDCYCNGKKMAEVFGRFTTEAREQLKKPVVDKRCGALVATNGWAMLTCDIPAGWSKEQAVELGFADNDQLNLPWARVLPDRKVNPYALACMERLATIEKRGDIHNLLMGLAKCAAATVATDSAGMVNRVFGLIGESQYNLCGVADLVESLFRLGSKTVGLYKEVCFGSVYESGPLHIVGIDGWQNNARALIMPVRCGGRGEIVFPVEKGGRAAA